MADELIPISNEEAMAILTGAHSVTTTAAPSFWDSYGHGLFNNIAAGTLLGANDELAAYSDTALEGVKSLFSKATGVDTGAPALSDLPKYLNARLAQEREAEKAFRSENPKTAIAANILGSVPTAIVSTPVLPESLVGQGATLGAVTGFNSGEGDLLDRAISSILGGGVGAVATPVVGGAINLGVRGAGKVAGFLDDFMSNQAGKLGEGGNVQMTPGKAYVSKAMRDATPDDLAKMAEVLTEAKSAEVPLSLADVVGPRGEAQAKFLANYSPAQEIPLGDGAKFSPREFLTDRIASQGKRVSGSLADLSPEQSASEAGQTLLNEAQALKNGLESARKKATAPLYQSIGDYPMTQEMADAVEDPIVLNAMNKLRSDPILAAKYANEPANSPQLMIATRKILREQSQNLAQAGEKEAASIVKQAQTKLTNALETQPEFKPANDLYRQMSEPINALEGTATTKGIAEKLLKLDKLDSADAGKLLMQLEPDQIAQFKTLLGNKGDRAMKAGVKAYMKDVIDNVKDTISGDPREVASKLFNTEALRDKGVAALGEKEFNKIFSKLKLEKKVSAGTSKFSQGSPTQPYFKAEEGLKEAIEPLKDVVSGRSSLMAFAKPLAKFFEANSLPSDAVAQEAALLMFDPMRGYQFINETLPLLQKLAARREAIDATSKLFGDISGNIAATQTGKIFGGK